MSEKLTAVPDGVRDEVERLKREVAALHAELPRNNLVVWTAGNVSARVPGADLLVIKPSGVSYDDITPEAMVVCGDIDPPHVHVAPEHSALCHLYGELASSPRKRLPVEGQ